MLKVTVPCRICDECIRNRKKAWRASPDFADLQREPSDLLERLDWIKVGKIDEDLDATGRTASFAYFMEQTNELLPELARHEKFFVALMAYVDHRILCSQISDELDRPWTPDAVSNRAARRRAAAERRKPNATH